MSHQAQQQWVAGVKAKYPDAFAGKRVLEIGSYNVNGTVRDLFADCDYVGIDVAPGRCVDVVDPKGAAHWLYHSCPALFDTVISCECLEHDVHWRTTLVAAVDALKPHGGLLILTCAASGRQEHGTPRTSPDDIVPGSPWPTHYKGLDEVDLRGALPMDAFLVYEFGKCENPADSYFWGIKK